MQSLRQALEQALVEAPDDVGAHMAYADWLMEQPDPRDQAKGEFIQVQLALEDESRPAEERKRLQQREQELPQAHEREWLGGLVECLRARQEGDRLVAYLGRPPFDVRFARGWLDEVHIPFANFFSTERLAQAPVARFLHRLSIENGYDEPSYWDDERQEEIRPPIPEGSPRDNGYLLPLFDAPCLAALRSFRLGTVPEESETMLHARIEGNLVPQLVAHMPRLEELRLFARYVDPAALFALSLPRLRVLQVYHLHDHAVPVLAANASLAGLTHLLFHGHANDPCYPDVHHQRPGPYLTADDLRAVARSPHLRSLTHLQFRLSAVGDAGCEEVVRSGLLRRLEVLDLKHGCITDRGAATLAASPDVRRLRRLNLSRNFLTGRGIEGLQRSGVALVAEEQHAAGDDHTWRMEGDWE